MKKGASVFEFHEFIGQNILFWFHAVYCFVLSPFPFFWVDLSYEIPEGFRAQFLTLQTNCIKTHIPLCIHKQWRTSLLSVN